MGCTSGWTTRGEQKDRKSQRVDRLPHSLPPRFTPFDTSDMDKRHKIDFDESRLSPVEREQMDHLIRQLPKHFQSQFTPEEQDKIRRAYRCEGWWRTVARNTGWSIGIVIASVSTARHANRTRKLPPFLTPGLGSIFRRTSAWRMRIHDESKRTLPRRELGLFRGWGEEVGHFGLGMLLVGWPLSRLWYVQSFAISRLMPCSRRGCRADSALFSFLSDGIGHFGGHGRFITLLQMRSGFASHQLDRAVMQAHEATMREYLDFFGRDLDVADLRVWNAYQAEDGSLFTFNRDPLALDSKGKRMVDFCLSRCYL